MDQKCNVNERDFDGASPLHYSASLGHVEVVRWLLTQGGAKVTLDNLGGSPLHNAAEVGHLKVPVLSRRKIILKYMNRIIYVFNKFHVPWSFEICWCSIALNVCACCFSNSLEVYNNLLQLLDSRVEKCKFVGKCCLPLFSVVSKHLKNGRNEKRVTGNVEEKRYFLTLNGTICIIDFLYLSNLTVIHDHTPTKLAMIPPIMTS